MTATQTSQVIAELESIVGRGFVVSDRAGLGVYELDASDEAITGIHRPVAAVLPATTEEVSAVARVAAKHGLPILARGSGTGLAGGAIATRGGIMIVTARMNEIQEISLVDRFAIVQPGVINLDLSSHLAPHGFYYAPDPSSQRACSIGGNLGNNSGGPHCLKYGVTNNHVLGLEVVLPGGDVCWFGGPSAENPGHDLTGLIVGSESTLGIITRAIVCILPMPESKGVLLASFQSMETASRAVSATIAAGILPSALEMMDKVTISAIEAGIGAGYPRDAAAVLLVELDGPRANVEREREQVAEILGEHGALEVSVARSEAEAALLWWGRKAAFGAMGRLAPNYHLTDTVVPRSKLPEAMRLVEEVGGQYNLTIANVFHAGDGNLHPLILFDRRESGIMERVLEASKLMMQHCIDLGGAISGEHGIGIEKNDALTLMFGDADFEEMAKVKRAFDPANESNPGKVFPSAFDPYATSEDAL